MTTRTVVVGGGIMGAGIAYEARVAGFPVTIVES
jgi:glycine/D-amino acid oxidase-like deaminating enzyme